jgi:hypothetical protein
MINPINPKRILIFLIAVLFFFGCSLFKKKATEPDIFAIKIETLSPDQYPDYIAQLKKISQESSNQAEIQKSHLLLATVSIYHKNPSPDYNLALKEFETYLKLNPEADEQDNIQNWILLLKELKKVKNNIAALKDQITIHSKNNRKLKKVISEHEKTIKKLKSDIKKLDSLYFDIEKKKKKKNNHQ